MKNQVTVVILPKQSTRSVVWVERQWLCNNIQPSAASNVLTSLCCSCRVWGWLHFYFWEKKIKEHLTETRKNLGFLLNNANSAPEVRKTMAMVGRRNYIGDTVKGCCSLIVCCRQILSFFFIFFILLLPRKSDASIRLHFSTIKKLVML